MKLRRLIILERSWRLLGALSPLMREVARKSQSNYVKLINVLGPEVAWKSQSNYVKLINVLDPEVARPSQLKQGITGGGCHK